MPSKSNKVKDLLVQFKKDHGDGIGQFDPKLVECARIPSGIFALDLATGGGLPKGKTTVIYGSESSNKTNLTLRIIALYQKQNPKEVCAFIDVEQAFSPMWASKLGVDTKKLLLIKPDYAEQAVDVVEALLNSDDCGLVVLDSVGAMAKMSELDNSAEKAVVGGASLTVGRMCRKAMHAQLAAEKEDRFPTLILINQIRFKVGVMFGDPESHPGGEALKHNAAMTIRMYGKNITDSSVSKTLPCRKQAKCILKKWKAPIFATHFDFEMVMVPHDGFSAGECDDLKTLIKYLKECGWVEKTEDGKWRLQVPSQKVFVAEKQYDIIDHIKQTRTVVSDELIRYLLSQSHDDAVGAKVAE